MEVIISKPENIKLKDVIQISLNMPNTTSSINILKEYTQNKLRKNLDNPSVYSYIKKGKNIISFGKIVSKDEIYEDMLNKLGEKKGNYLIGTNLLTIKKYRGKGYAQILKQEQVKYIKKKYPKIEKIVGATIDKGLLNLYESYGCKYIGKYNMFNTNIYFYYYNI